MTQVSNQAQLQAAVASRETEIVVLGEVSMTGPTTIGYAVSMRGEQGASIVWAGPRAGRRNLFTVTAAGDLTLDSLLFDAGNRDGTFVQINGGRLTMNDGVVMQNIRSTTANGAVKVGDIAQTYGGTFIMNGGLITAIDTSDAVTNFGGTVVMNNDAAISDNMAAGITMSRPVYGGERAALTMTGHSRISGNVSKQSGGAGILLDSDVIMGVAPGDAPSVTGNSSPYYCGAWFINELSTLTMRFGAEISGNQAADFIGGLAVVRSELAMHDNAIIKDNISATDAGGLMLATGATATMDGNAQITGNIAPGIGGGIFMQNRSTLNMAGNAAIHDNTAIDGAGVFIGGSTVTLGADGSSPSIYGNAAADSGGGAYITQGSTLNVFGRARFYGNSAVKGKGIYDGGALNVADSLQVTDGLYFGDLTGDDADGMRLGDIPGGFSVEELDGRLVLSVTGSMEPPAMATAVQVPVIVRTLSADAKIQLEASPYVSPENVPLKIAEKAADSALLGETDRAAWLIPPEFTPGYTVILNEGIDEVWIAHKSYTIIYHELNGASNDNPDTYTAVDLPLELVPPGRRPGYRFVGWQDLRGRLVSEIPVGSDQNIELIAIWQAMSLSFHENGDCVCNMPADAPIRQGDTVIIPCVIPQRKGFYFLCWSTAPVGVGTIYVPGNTLSVAESGITLYARWLSAKCCCCGACKQREICDMVDWPQE